MVANRNKIEAISDKIASNKDEMEIDDETMAADRSEVAQWLSGRSILVTGGSGFIGKLLLEKLLRGAPDLRTIYVLMRSKRGLAPSARLEAMVKLPVFDLVRRECPSALSKLVAVEGDLLLPSMGVRQHELNTILSEVSVVFHCGASLRLEAGLKAAVLHNTTATHRLLQLAARMEKLQVLVHVSTSFCHCEEEVLEERVYPAPHNPHDIMRLVEWLDDESLEAITPRLLHPHPNCYTYSKRLAETLVAEQFGKLPVVICRPSIVTPALRQPHPGWVDTLNGPIGVVVGAGKGVIRSMLCGPDFYSETVPVDVAANAIIAVAWDTAARKPASLPVFNVSSNALVRVTWGEVLDRGRQLVYRYPFEGAAWYPGGDIRTNRIVHNTCVIFQHILPAYLIDLLLTIARQKRFMVRLQKRISTGLEVLQYFTMRQWNFKNDQILSLSERMTKRDRETFYISNVNYDVDEFLLNALLGARQYCMKEPLSSLPKARRHLKMLYWLDWLMKLLLVFALLYFLCQYSSNARAFFETSTKGLRSIPTVGNFVPH